MHMWSAVVASTVALSGLYILVGLGWVLIYRTTGVVMFAMGQFVVLGAYLLYAATTQWHLPFLLAVLVAAATAAALGFVVYLIVLRPLAGQPEFALIIVTFGVSIIMSGLFPMVWGPAALNIDVPISNHRLVSFSSGVYFTTYEVLTVAAALMVIGCYIAFLRLTRAGARMQASAELPLLASQSGIQIGRVYGLGWVLAIVPVALAGMSLGAQAVVSVSLADIGLRAIVPVIIGGLDSVEGLMVGAVLVAFVQNLAISLFGADSQDAVVYCLLLVALLVRPYGLFGRAEIRRV